MAVENNEVDGTRTVLMGRFGNRRNNGNSLHDETLNWEPPGFQVIQSAQQPPGSQVGTAWYPVRVPSGIQLKRSAATGMATILPSCAHMGELNPKPPAVIQEEWMADTLTK
ncbi:hypothetical protein FB45DRAFT_863783 [Roridomyces roridus]|uniref:Uncharacterized protein n=1 Tax=Roridomyces roridus TaxID=1738132 RepID=A0AAD7FTY2_9AGAR|nr:hypothetical protein FB45DRAFT_863783 [Roridomyces roridus]